MFINFWIYYILNDKMPKIYTDSKTGKQEIWAVLYWLLLSLLYIFIMYLILEYIHYKWVLLWVPVFIVYIITLIYGICKILKYKL